MSRGPRGVDFANLTNSATGFGALPWPVEVKD
jgi:hypothetical protein